MQQLGEGKNKLIEIDDALAVELLDVEADEDRAIEEVENFRLNLMREAFGYDVEEVDTVFDADGNVKNVIRRQRHIPGDQKALEKYLSMFGRP